MSAPKLQIFGMGGSTCTQRVLMTLKEHDAPFEINFVDLRKGEHKQPAHLARQPFGQIPVAQDGDFIVYESRAIARYVNDTRGNKLVPADPKARAVMEQWMSLEQGTITPEISGIVAQRLFAPMFGGSTDEDAVKKHVEKAKLGLDVLDKHLAGKQFICGDQFTLVDVFFMPYFALCYHTPEASLLSSRPNIDAWFKRVSARPSWTEIQKLNEFAQKKE